MKKLMASLLVFGSLYHKFICAAADSVDPQQSLAAATLSQMQMAPELMKKTGPRIKYTSSKSMTKKGKKQKEKNRKEQLRKNQFSEMNRQSKNGTDVYKRQFTVVKRSLLDLKKLRSKVTTRK